MYEELVGDLRYCDKGDCNGCRRYTKDTRFCNTLLRDAADAIEELSKRETPMLVRMTTSTKRCPSCNKQVSGRGNIHGNYRFCRWCGQALDWTEPPKEEE